MANEISTLHLVYQCALCEWRWRLPILQRRSRRTAEGQLTRLRVVAAPAAATRGLSQVSSFKFRVSGFNWAFCRAHVFQSHSKVEYSRNSRLTKLPLFGWP